MEPKIATPLNCGAEISDESNKMWLIRYQINLIVGILNKHLLLGVYSVEYKGDDNDKQTAPKQIFQYQWDKPKVEMIKGTPCRLVIRIMSIISSIQ